MLEQPVQLIDVNTCAQIAIDSGRDTVLSAGGAIGVIFVGMVIFFILYIFTASELALAKDYLRRRNGLNDFETWKKDREVKV